MPATILTGFLGSGKTTVLNRLLRAPDLADTAVIVNEFGEVGLDHLLIEQALENTVLLKNGCICCSVRGDVLDTLQKLFRKRDSGEIPWFRRIAIETTGLADPAPVAHTLIDTNGLCHLDGIVTTVDAQHGIAQLHRQPEARQQITHADRVLLTKTDLVAPADTASVEAAIRRHNPNAPIRRTALGGVSPDDFFGVGAQGQPALWLHSEDRGHHHHHHGEIVSTLLCAPHPMRASALALWLDSLLSLRGADIPRLKGIVRLEGDPCPIVVQAVHHVLHPMTRLSAQAAARWHGAGAELVAIHRGLPDAGLRASFDAVLG